MSLYFLNDIHRRLSSVIRYNTTHKIRQESVAEHSFYVALYTMFLCDYLGMRPSDTLKAMRMAILHDIEESFSGDIIYEIKRHSPEFQTAVHDMNVAILDKTLGGFPCEQRDKYRELWMEYSKRYNGIAKVVEMADDISAWSFASEEGRMGNSFFASISINIWRRIVSSGLYNKIELLFVEGKE